MNFEFNIVPSHKFCDDKMFTCTWNIHYNKYDGLGMVPPLIFEIDFSNLKLTGHITILYLRDSLGATNVCFLNLESKSQGNWNVLAKLNRNGSSVNFPRFYCGKQNSHKFIFNGCINAIRCEVFFLDYITEDPRPRSIEINKLNSTYFGIKDNEPNDGFVELFENKKYWDVTLIVKGDELHAHKCILASRSKVFAAMFEHEIEEAKTNKVTITDIDLEVFNAMLRYMYTNQVLNINEMASKLLAVSDKYDLQNLKSICESELSKRISIETAADTLILADLHNAKKLQDDTVNFIKKNAGAVALTEGWKKIVKSKKNYSDLLVEVCLQIVK